MPPLNKHCTQLEECDMYNLKIIRLRKNLVKLGNLHQADNYDSTLAKKWDIGTLHLFVLHNIYKWFVIIVVSDSRKVI